MGFLNGDGKKKRGGVVYLTDYAETNGILDGFSFEGCHVMGPAVMVVQGEFDLVNNTIEGDLDAFLWEIKPERERVSGAIVVKDTTFEGCTFTNVGLAGYPDFIEEVRQGVEARHAIS
jgi:hypothetical protein